MSTVREQLKHRLVQYTAFVLASEVRWAAVGCLRNLGDERKARAIVSLQTERARRGTVLLSHFIEPFLNAKASLDTSHTRYWEALQMARTFLNLGYDVDAISYRNNGFRPARDYAVLVDLRHNMQRLASLLPQRSLKVCHLDTAHILFHNAAEANRLLMLQERRGVTLRPRRFEWPNLGLEHADCATILGNEFTMQTYAYAKKRLFRLPIPSAFTHPWIEGRDYERARRHFLFFSSGGLVHKGLDLTLEAFAGMPDYDLTVCAPIDDEPDFKAAYRQELFELPNVHTVGWMDIGSRAFIDLVQHCGAVLSPSCSEGASGALVTCLHAGLVPIASYESGVDVLDFGLMLDQCTVSHIRKNVEHLAGMPPSELKQRSRGAWEYARSYHTREHYTKRYHEVIAGLVSATGEIPQ